MNKKTIGDTLPNCKQLIVLLVNLKVSLRMLANGADLRSLGAHYDVTAVAAFPNLYL